MSRKSHARRRTMVRLHGLQDGVCAHCREPVEPPPATPRRLLKPADPSLDHVKPRSKGGTYAIINLLLSHRSCNIARGDEPIGEGAREVWRSNLVKLGYDPQVKDADRA